MIHLNKYIVPILQKKLTLNNVMLNKRYSWSEIFMYNMLFDRTDEKISEHKKKNKIANKIMDKNINILNKRINILNKRINILNKRVNILNKKINKMIIIGKINNIKI